MLRHGIWDLIRLYWGTWTLWKNRTRLQTLLLVTLQFLLMRDNHGQLHQESKVLQSFRKRALQSPIQALGHSCRYHAPVRPLAGSITNAAIILHSTIRGLNRTIQIPRSTSSKQNGVDCKHCRAANMWAGDLEDPY